MTPYVYSIKEGYTQFVYDNFRIDYRQGRTGYSIIAEINIGTINIHYRLSWYPRRKAEELTIIDYKDRSMLLYELSDVTECNETISDHLTKIAEIIQTYGE